MGVIMKRGINYIGSVGIELTQAEYDALSEAEKKNGTVYFITDGQGGGGNLTAGEGIDITNDVISVNDKVAITSSDPAVKRVYASSIPFGTDQKYLQIASGSMADTIENNDVAVNIDVDTKLMRGYIWDETLTTPNKWKNTFALDLEDTGWQTLNDIIKYRMKNGVCTVAARGAVTSDIAASSYGNIGNLPSKFRPSVPLYFEIHVHNFSSVLKVNTNGDVDVWGATSGITTGLIVSGTAIFPAG